MSDRKTNMICGHCGARLSTVLDSRPGSKENRILRRRECNAGHRITTIEVPIVEFKKWMQAMKSAGLLSEQLAELTAIDDKDLKTGLPNWSK